VGSRQSEEPPFCCWGLFLFFFPLIFFFFQPGDDYLGEGDGAGGIELADLDRVPFFFPPRAGFPSLFLPEQLRLLVADVTRDKRNVSLPMVPCDPVGSSFFFFFFFLPLPFFWAWVAKNPLAVNVLAEGACGIGGFFLFPFLLAELSHKKNKEVPALSFFLFFSFLFPLFSQMRSYLTTGTVC